MDDVKLYLEDLPHLQLVTSPPPPLRLIKTNRATNLTVTVTGIRTGVIKL